MAFTLGVSIKVTQRACSGPLSARISDSYRPGVELRICISNMFSDNVKSLVPRPHFEKHCRKQPILQTYK